MRNIRTLLAGAGAAPEHICKVVIYITDPRYREVAALRLAATGEFGLHRSGFRRSQANSAHDSDNGFVEPCLCVDAVQVVLKARRQQAIASATA